MKCRLFLVVLILIILSQRVLTQVVFRYGTELGVFISQFPKRDSYSMTFDSTTDHVHFKKGPVTSPLIGINGQLIILKHFQLAFGLQYQMTGTRNYEHRIRYMIRYAGSLTFDDETWRIQTVHKFTLPISSGFTFKIKIFQPTIFIGLRPNLLLKGKDYNRIYSKSFYSSNPNNPVIYSSEIDEFGFIRDRFRTQFLLGLSSGIGKNLEITMCLNKGKPITYLSNLSMTQYSMTNNDFGISITYFFNHTKKGKAVNKRQ